LKDLDCYQGFRSFILRYFSAAGADPGGKIGEWHSPETHAIPIAMDAALGRRPYFQIFGTDYDTRDGTCVRDFVHVLDLADAHSRAVQYLLSNGESQALNLGTGHGTTVKELLEAVRQFTGRRFDIRLAPRREGDSPALVADSTLARRTIGWSLSRISSRLLPRPGIGMRTIFRPSRARARGSLRQRVSVHAVPRAAAAGLDTRSNCAAAPI
jgi:UDP-glucose 4-epimerase